jgi:predicted nucleic acid-binding protein
VSGRNVVDSSAWLEYFADTGQAGHFAKALQDTANLIVPVIILYEVFKKVLRERSEGEALQVVSQMQVGTVVGVDSLLAMEAARYPLPLAESIIYATAMSRGATLWTQDAHFRELPNVR